MTTAKLLCMTRVQQTRCSLMPAKRVSTYYTVKDHKEIASRCLAYTGTQSSQWQRNAMTGQSV